jgi:hypothetical protein
LVTHILTYTHTNFYRFIRLIFRVLFTAYIIYFSLTMKTLASMLSTMKLLAGLALFGTTLASPVDFMSMSYTTLPPLASTPTGISAPKSEVLIAERTINTVRGGELIAPGWTFIACSTDEINARALQNQVQIAGGPGAMSVENCNYRCEVDDYLLSGVEFGHECWCDHALNGEYHVKVDDSECNMECSGNSMQSCGGANRIAIYEYNFTQVVTVTTEKPSPGGHGDLDARSVDIVSLYAPIGCYTDSVTARMLRNYTVSPGAAQALNVGICTTACYDLAFPYAGLEFGQECFCDTLMQTIVKAPEAECNMTCSGDTGEICGGDLRINIYSYNGTTPLTATSTTAMPTSTSSVTSTSTNLAITAPGAYKSLGCYSDITSNRTLGFVGDYPGAHGNMTIEPCQGACENAGYVFAGVEFGDECWCDNVIRGIGTSVSSTDCNMPCSGNTSETCGGSNRINVYRFTPSGSFVPIGCYTDSRSNRTLGFVGDFPGAKEEGMII